MDNESSAFGPTGGNPRRNRRSRTRTVTATAVVALIVIAALVVVLATRGGGKKPTPAAPPPAPSTPTSSTAAAPPSLPAADQAVPDSPPAGVNWSLFQGVALPVSATAGPSRVAGPVYAGYAHTPTGALIAANQIGVRYVLTPGDGWRQVVAQQVLPGAGRDAFTTNRARVTTTSESPGSYGQIAGFRFVTYDPDVAVIELVTRFSSGTLQVTTSTVRWADGDWRLQLQPDGGTSPTAQRVDNLAGYVPWGGV